MLRQTPCVMTVTHERAGDDGAQSIVNYLAEKYALVARDDHAFENVAGRIARDRKTGTKETIVLESPYPRTAGGVCESYGIPPQHVTHVLVLLDARRIESDPYGTGVKEALRRNGATGVGIGGIWQLMPDVEGLTDYDDFPQQMLNFIAYIEQYLGIPALYIATGPGTVVDREPFKAHEQDDKSTLLTYGEREIEHAV